MSAKKKSPGPHKRSLAPGVCRKKVAPLLKVFSTCCPGRTQVLVQGLGPCRPLNHTRNIENMFIKHCYHK